VEERPRLRERRHAADAATCGEQHIHMFKELQQVNTLVAGPPAFHHKQQSIRCQLPMPLIREEQAQLAENARGEELQRPTASVRSASFTPPAA
jgi:hypothetical protein